MTVLFKGIIVTLLGAFVTPGTEAPDFNLVKNDLSEYPRMLQRPSFEESTTE